MTHSASAKRRAARSRLTKIAWVPIAGSTLLLIGCRAGVPTRPSTLDRDAEAYVHLVLALAERDPDWLDSYYGPQAWHEQAAAQHLSVHEIHRCGQALLEHLERGAGARASKGSSDDDRRSFLIHQARAIVARADLLTGSRRPFAEEGRLLFGLAPPPIDFRSAEAVRRTIDRLLPGRGDLVTRLAAFNRRLIIPGERLPAVLSQAVVECRRVTRAHIRLPDDEHVRVEYLHDLPWSAFTRYEGHHQSRVTVNASAGFTVDEVLQLACHEAYPGHHVINLLVDDDLVRAKHRIELVVQPLFSPQALLAEGAASIAPRLAFPDEERVAVERAVLFPLAGLDPSAAEPLVRVSRALEGLDLVRLNIAARYLDGELEFARAATALERDGLMPSPEATLKFLNEFRTYVLGYTRGPQLAAAYLDARTAGGAVDRWATYVELVTRPDQALAK